MQLAHSVAVVIPCLNEAATIFNLVSEVRRLVPHVIVVDDGSTDSTATLAREAGAEVVQNAIPQGKGAALVQGWTRAREKGFDWALCMDGDGQHTPQDIRRFLEAPAAPLIIGNRMDDTSHMPWLRRTVNRWMSRRISQLAGQELPDTQCGFRLMNLNAWATLEITAAHFEIESEILVSFVAAGHAVKFVPVQVIYRNERSKIHPLQDTVRWFRWWKAARRNFSRRKLSTVNTADVTA
jgi:glycosyltransferase involved in cell wall biosynthesis